jgi:hypothetical protein
MAALRVVHEKSMEESRILFAELRSFRRSIFAIALVMVVLLAASVGMVLFLVVRP